MKRALISTLFNEAGNIGQWLECLSRQTVPPDEIVIVDGESTDGTWETLQAFAARSAVPVILIRQHCNIAEGRNRAIKETDADIVATIDGGSFAEPDWFAQITKPLADDPELDMVGGRSSLVYENAFQQFLQQIEPRPESAHDGGGVRRVTPPCPNMSSRNAAFRRRAWADVGGYPEWLTLTAEDALFNVALGRIGKAFAYNPDAVVRWPVRSSEKAFFKMQYNYGFGSAEAQLDASFFLKRLVIAIFPLLLLFSRHRLRHLRFRYLKNYASAIGWLRGKLMGRRPPAGWRRFDGVLLGPEAQKHL